jgi:ribosomal protein S19E (S16A)
MANKTTKRQVIEAMLNEEVISSNEVYTQFLKHELELLNRKKSGSAKPTKEQEANENIKNIILATLAEEDKDKFGMTVTGLQFANSTLHDLSNQKISALLRQLKESGLVNKEKKGRTTLFTLA